MFLSPAAPPQREQEEWQVAQARFTARKRFHALRRSIVSTADGAASLASTLRQLVSTLNTGQGSTADGDATSVASSVAPPTAATAPTAAGPAPDDAACDSVEGVMDMSVDLWGAFTRADQYRLVNKARGAHLDDAILSSDRGYYYAHALNEGHFLNFCRDFRLWLPTDTPSSMRSLFSRNAVVLKEEAQVVHARRHFMSHADPSGSLPSQRLLATVRASGLQVPRDEVMDFKARAGDFLTWEAFYTWWDDRRRQAQGRGGFADDNRPPTRPGQLNYCGLTKAGFIAAMQDIALRMNPPSASCTCVECDAASGRSSQPRQQPMRFASQPPLDIVPAALQALCRDGTSEERLLASLMREGVKCHLDCAVNELMFGVLYPRLLRVEHTDRCVTRVVVWWVSCKAFGYLFICFCRLLHPCGMLCTLLFQTGHGGAHRPAAAVQGRPGRAHPI